MLSVFPVLYFCGFLHFVSSLLLLPPLLFASTPAISVFLSVSAVRLFPNSLLLLHHLSHFSVLFRYIGWSSFIVTLPHLLVTCNSSVRCICGLRLSASLSPRGTIVHCYLSAPPFSIPFLLITSKLNLTPPQFNAITLHHTCLHYILTLPIPYFTSKTRYQLFSPSPHSNTISLQYLLVLPSHLSLDFNLSFLHLFDLSALFHFTTSNQHLNPH